MINKLWKQAYSYNSIIANAQKEIGLKMVDIILSTLCARHYAKCFLHIVSVRQSLVLMKKLRFREAKQFP